jgi:Zinc finger, C2H2 type
MKARHATAGAFKCALCSEEFYRPENRIQHMSRDHRGEIFCTVCNIQFSQNSRYAKHMMEMHNTKVDAVDHKTLDLHLEELLYSATIRNPKEDLDTTEDLPQTMPKSETPPAQESAMTRDDFISRYIKPYRDSKRCSDCKKSFNKNSLHAHLIKYHSNTLPFKCSFCDHRFERLDQRFRHLNIHHPDKNKCAKCGMQFHKHTQFIEHMLADHNVHVKLKKPPGEEKDLSSFEMLYSKRRHENTDEQDTQDEEDSFLKLNTSSGSQSDRVLRTKIKEEPTDTPPIMHSIFGEEEPLVSETSVKKELYTYTEFKLRFTKEHDALNFFCSPCQQVFPKTSSAAHMRLWHASTACFFCEICSEGFKRMDYRARHLKSSHPLDYFCRKCDIQFHRSVLYIKHMLEAHQKKVSVPVLKRQDEIDIPLEKLKFVEKVTPLT